MDLYRRHEKGPRIWITALILYSDSHKPTRGPGRKLFSSAQKSLRHRKEKYTFFHTLDESEKFVFLCSTVQSPRPGAFTFFLELAMMKSNSFLSGAACAALSKSATAKQLSELADMMVGINDCVIHERICSVIGCASTRRRATATLRVRRLVERGVVDPSTAERYLHFT